jgi:hypothetical protein
MKMKSMSGFETEPSLVDPAAKIALSGKPRVYSGAI